MATSPSCTTPVPIRAVSPSVLDQLHFEEDTFDFGVVTSPGSKRCPTFKDYAEKIKQLQQENFQLRVRIYLSEQKAGVKASSSDLAVLYSHLPQIQAGGAVNNGLLGTSHSTVHTSPSATSASAFESLNNELDKLKSEKLHMAESIRQTEEKLRDLEQNLAEKQQEIQSLTKQNEDLVRKGEVMERELSSFTTVNQKVNGNLCNQNNNEDEVERLACFAFGQNDDVEYINAEWEAKMSEKNNELKKLEGDLDHTRQKLESANRTISGLRSEVRKYEVDRPSYEFKIREMSESLKEMGQRYIRKKSENEKLIEKLKEKTSGNLDRIVQSSYSQEKLSEIQEVVNLLQSRMKELTSFVETLLQLESKNVFTLTGLTDANRENLLKCIEQSRMFSESLNQLLDRDLIMESHATAISGCFSKALRRESHRHPSTGFARSAASSFDRGRLRSEGVQCSILDSSLLNSLEAANTYISRLKSDIASIEKINAQLNQDKAELLSRVKSLESSLNILRLTNNGDRHGDEVVNSKIKEENRKLTKRLTVTEDALRHLHTQHAKLVGELKTLRSTYQKPSKVTGNSLDAGRPSDSNSPDLGIDSGHDGAVNSDDSNGNNYKEENRILRTTNRELALKLKQTRQALDITMEKLNSTTKEKEQVEKAICRQLHKTHTILRQAKRSVEKFTSSQCQENIMPSS